MDKAQQKLVDRLEGILASNLQTEDWVLVWSSEALNIAGMLSGASMRDAMSKAQFIGFNLGGQVPAIRTRLELAGQVPLDMTNAQADEHVAQDIMRAFVMGMQGGVKSAHDDKAGVKI